MLLPAWKRQHLRPLSPEAVFYCQMASWKVKWQLQAQLALEEIIYFRESVCDEEHLSLASKLSTQRLVRRSLGCGFCGLHCLSVIFWTNLTELSFVLKMMPNWPAEEEDEGVNYSSKQKWQTVFISDELSEKFPFLNWRNRVLCLNRSFSPSLGQSCWNNCYHKHFFQMLSLKMFT